MSYLVLARKYRPKNFAQMVGQDHVVRALSNALDARRLHHAYLFTGTRGVGKTTVSRILAKSLNCLGADGHGGITSAPCGVCQACRDIDEGRFVDYTELDAASNRGVDDVQMLLEQAVYKPVQGRFKVFMVDEVHMLTGHAFNAMLKTLEEPPEYLKFVLATTDPQKVPVTVLSRCLQFNLRPMPPETVFEHLRRVLQDEAVPAEEAALRALARAARGSMRDALSLTDQAIAFGNGSVAEAQVLQMLGTVGRSHVLALVEALADGVGARVVGEVDRLRGLGLSPASTLEQMSEVLQRMAVHQLAGPLPDEADAESTQIAALAHRLPPDETQLLYSLCLHGRTELGLAPDEYAALTMVLLRLLAFKPVGLQQDGLRGEKKTPDDAGHRPSLTRVPDAAAAQGLASPGSPSVPAPPAPSGRVVPVVLDPSARPPQAASAPSAVGGPAHAGRVPPPAPIPVRMHADPRIEAAIRLPTAGQGVVPTEEGDFWYETVSELVRRESVTALVRELALQSQLVARDSDQWQLRVERESLNQASTRDRLAGALRAAGHAVSLAVEIGRVVDSPARRNAAAAAERQLAAEKLVFDDPFVQSMMREFDAKIVPGSIRATAAP